jgi:hypothetical protein
MKLDTIHAAWCVYLEALPRSMSEAELGVRKVLFYEGAAGALSVLSEFANSLHDYAGVDALIDDVDHTVTELEIECMRTLADLTDTVKLPEGWTQ